MEISDNLDSIIELLKYIQCNIDRLEQKMDKVEQKMDKVEQKIDKVEQKLDNLNNKTENMEQDCTQMRNHIDFIEDTYSKVRAPLNFFTNQINALISNDNGDLPLLKNGK